jgi:DNA-binding transcriptional LysR family regulator
MTLMLIASEAVTVVPRRVASDLVAIYPLVMRPLPFPSPRVTLSMIWHHRLDNHPARCGCVKLCRLRLRKHSQAVGNKYPWSLT